jgi:hypothetical protein
VARPVIALLTDFGTRDHYVGAMRGVVLGIAPEATLVDITHDIEPQDVLGGALALAAAYQYFPLGTIFLAVVDPGVGTARRGIAVAAGGYRFVAPDNGLLTLVLGQLAPVRVVELAEGPWARSTVSRTFEGRDRFAPAAAWLATGLDVGALGPVLPTWVRLDVPEPSIRDGWIVGAVMRVDRFGNLVTNIDRQMVGRAIGGDVDVVIAGQRAARMVATYGEVEQGTICALFGSDDHLEVAVVGGSAAARLGLARGAPVTVTRR